MFDLKKIITAIAVLLASYFGKLVINDFQLDKGHIEISQQIVVDSSSFRLVTISNYDESNINNLKIKVPLLDKKEIAFDSDLVVEKDSITKGAIKREIIIISNIPKKKSVYLYIPISNKDNSIEVINNEEFNFTVNDTSKAENPLEGARKDILIQSAFNVLIYFLIYSWLDSKLTRAQENQERLSKEYDENLQKRADEAEQKIDAANENLKEKSLEWNRKLDKKELEMKEIDNSIKELKLSSVRNRMFLLKRIKEYNSELLFWRNTHKQILIHEYTKREVEQAFYKISNVLNTQSTHADIQSEYDKVGSLFELADKISKENE